MSEKNLRCAGCFSYNDFFDLSLPSAGALEEAYEKFVKPCRISALAGKGMLCILDVCFGLGYNSLSALKCALEANPCCKIFVAGLENNKNIIDMIQNLSFPAEDEKYYRMIKQGRGEAVEVNLIKGDARKSVKCLGCIFDAVFFDPFTIKTSPGMWQVSFLKDIFRVMKSGAVIATHSAGPEIRRIFSSAGFAVKTRRRSGRWAESVFAVKP